MTRILLYGGCHALVLRDYLRQAFADRFECTLIVNFELIGSGTAFPYSSLDRFDAVLFSPIENKVGYNTSDLVEACERRGIPTICFAWMEWHGYFPGAIKGVFNGCFRWHYPGLVKRAANHVGSFEAFCDEVIATFPDDADIDAVFKASTAHLRAAERRHGIAPAMSDYILQNYRAHRLFLVPDHAGRQYYLRLLRAILPRLGIDEEEVEHRLSAVPPHEPQWRWRMPVFPRVAQRLGLTWTDTDWIDDEIFPGRTLDLRDYLAQYGRGGSGRSATSHAGFADLAGFADQDGRSRSRALTGAIASGGDEVGRGWAGRVDAAVKSELMGSK